MTNTDATDFPVNWTSDEERKLYWAFDPTHTPDPATPLGLRRGVLFGLTPSYSSP